VYAERKGIRLIDLAGLGRGEEILRTMMEIWDRDAQK